jgi:uncharacterized protein (DUF305 family)
MKVQSKWRKIVVEKTKRPEIKKMAEDIINAQSGEITTDERMAESVGMEDKLLWKKI